jgi:hypothetical protein
VSGGSNPGKYASDAVLGGKSACEYDVSDDDEDKATLLFFCLLDEVRALDGAGDRESEIDAKFENL